MKKTSSKDNIAPNKSGTMKATITINSRKPRNPTVTAMRARVSGAHKPSFRKLKEEAQEQLWRDDEKLKK